MLSEYIKVVIFVSVSINSMKLKCVIVWKIDIMEEIVFVVVYFDVCVV